MDTNTEIKTASLELMSLAGPEAEFLSIFVGLLWPESAQEDPWDKIRERTEKLINDRLDQDAYQRLKQRLQGIKDVLVDYNNTMGEKIDPRKKYDQFRITHEKFVGEIPSFQEATHARILLPLFMQCANLHLLLMKHAYKTDPKVFGFEPDDITALKKDLDAGVDKYTAYAKSVLSQGPDIKLVDPCDLYVQQVTIDVADYLELWSYMKADSNPPSGMPLPREVFSTKVGVNNAVSPDNQPNGRDGYFSPVPAQDRLTRLRMWSGKYPMPNMLVAVEEWHGAMDRNQDGFKRGGPGGIPRIEHYNPYSETICDIDLTKNAIASVKCYVQGAKQDNPAEGDCLSGIEFTLDDGSTKSFVCSDGQGTVELRVPDDHYVSSINVISSFDDRQRGHLTNDLLRTLYFGFRFKPELFEH